jgi:hypothetical protein
LRWCNISSLFYGGLRRALRLNEEAHVDKARAFLAIVLLSVAVVVALVATPARAAAASDAELTAARLADSSASLDQRIARLGELERSGHRRTSLRLQVRLADRRLIHLTRACSTLQRSVLDTNAPDEATNAAVLDIDARVLRLDREAVRLSRRALRHPRRISVRLERAAQEVRLLDARVRTRPTLISPNGGSVVQGVPTTVQWTMRAAVSTGSFRLALKSTVGGSRQSLIESDVAAIAGTTQYTVPWNVAQAVGPSYRLWVYYCGSNGRVISSDASDGTLDVTATTPDPTPTSTPTSTPTPTYGCTKPVTTSVLRNFAVAPGTHDVTYSYVRFEGYTGPGTPAGAGSTACVRMQTAAPGTSIYNVTFDHCVFATPPAGVTSNGVHIWSYRGSTVYNITFRDCWFEPQSRMGIEINGRGGWWHDVTIDHCTFEPLCGEILSFDMSPDGGDPSPPYGINVGGVVRGVEGLQVTNNDLRGTGVTVGGIAPRYKMGIELGCVYPYGSVGASQFSNNKVGRCASSWLNCDYSPASGMTFANNLFDWSYNPGRIAGSHDGPISGALNGCEFSHSTWVLGTTLNEPYKLVSGGGDGNAFSGEDWTKPSGSIGGGAGMPFTNSTYASCHFHLHDPVIFPDSASGTGCVFDGGHSGGTFK